MPTMLSLEDLDLKKVEVNVEKIKSFSSKEEYMSLAVELLVEISTITVASSCIYKLDENNKPRKWKRNEAILGGLMVRMSKLQSSFLDQVCQKRMEIAMIMLRCLGESFININYLLKNSKDELFDKFIEYSLREEKRLLNRINENISKRGRELPIEKRMKVSIERAFKTSNFTPEDVDETQYQSWEETIFKRAKKVGMERIYEAFFSLPSHSVHGNWQDLLTNHLEYDNGEFSPSLDWNYPRPQPIFGIALLSAETNKLYAEKVIHDCADRDRLLNMIQDFYIRVKKVDELHEEFLNR